jgi:hypothetical protein
MVRTGVLMAAICFCLQGQETPGNPPVEVKGLAPRAAPGDYQGQAQAGAVTIAADFKGHSLPTPQGTLSAEEFVVVETAFFGAPGARLALSAGDFSLRINGKKTPLPEQPYAVVMGEVKDPEWEPPEADKQQKSKTNLNTGGEKPEGDKPAKVEVPFPIRRALAQRVQKAALPEGDRALPQAGLIFFQYRGKEQSIHSVELIYAGPAGKATITLQP